jgi:hypothetical protein
LIAPALAIDFCVCLACLHILLPFPTLGCAAESWKTVSGSRGKLEISNYPHKVLNFYSLANAVLRFLFVLSLLFLRSPAAKTSRNFNFEFFAVLFFSLLPFACSQQLMNGIKERMHLRRFLLSDIS